MFLKLIALAAVGGAAWLFMRPQIPILPPGIISRKRKGLDSEDAVKGKKRASGNSTRPMKVCLLLLHSRTAKEQSLTQTSDNIQLSNWTILDASGPHSPHFAAAIKSDIKLLALRRRLTSRRGSRKS